MEDRGKSKLLNTTVSCQGHAVRAATEGLIDRLSNLPDHVAHHILSFLEITDLTRFGCVSKGCRELYLSTPSLNFDGFSSEHLQGYDQRLRLWSYLDRYFFHRGVNKLERFHFHWELHYADQQTISREDENFRLDKWIYNAIRCNVEVLDIKIKSRYLEAPPLPFCVLLSRSLKSLSVHMYGNISKAPSPASFSNLECLKLRGVILVDEGFSNGSLVHAHALRNYVLHGSVVMGQSMSLLKAHLWNHCALSGFVVFIIFTLPVRSLEK
ncbi:putative F-box domain, leucine-rich repeat domain, L domain-containing protein [Rosa chinensis]|uniref:Putative F-box domain, leucine-rich repeat domain, L domain-containing protein n=1 Tax=Rosa chinensis TaxID=74649 RepID=A0A2P6RC18_ROSCH|nr:putative F-box domain, leucine-rich repeat domain, L domain-containing protein [Rosa chinensis]